MIINRYGNPAKQFIKGLFQGNNAVLYWHTLRYTQPTVKKIQSMTAGGTVPLFQKIELETINRCNGGCAFCPVNRNADKRPFARMNEELFDKIIGELGAMDYSGELALYSNNEPFMDVRMEQLVKKARQAVPHAFIHLSSNGEILPLEKALAVLPYVDRLIINNYNDQLQLNTVSKELDKLCQKDPEMNRKVELHLRKVNEVLFTRAGQAPNNAKKKEYKMPCIMPFIQMVVRPTGQVSLCCNDAMGKMTMGDCNTQSLLEIWQSEPFQKVRKAVSVGRGSIDLCKYCDFFVKPDQY